MKPLRWISDARKTLSLFPDPVKDDLGYLLHLVQMGASPPNADHLPELGAGIMELKAHHDTETYRAFYVVKFAEAIYVLDAIHKKSKRGRQLPKEDQDRIKHRYKQLVAYRKDAGLP